MTYFLAYSNDAKVRRFSTSGGATKEILRHALATGFVDRLVFPRMAGIRAEVICTSDPADLLTPKANSVYQPVSSLRGLREVPEGMKAGITLLPCHLEAAQRCESTRAKIGLSIELLCDYVPTMPWTNRLIESFDVSPSEVDQLFYRRGNWPGRTEVHTPTQVYSRHWGGDWDSDPTVDAPKACQQCTRIECHGDIVVGDPWRLEKKHSGQPGKTMLWVVNPEVLPLVESANLTLEPITAADWAKSTRKHNQNKEARESKSRSIPSRR